LSEVCLLYAIRWLIVGVSSQRTGFDPVRVRIGLEVDTRTVGGFLPPSAGLSRLSFQQCSVVTLIHAPSQPCRLDSDTMAKQTNDISHRHDVSGVGLIALVINTR
jgi:hypothetical protein